MAGRRRTMRPTWIPNVLLVFALPFIMGTIQGGTNRLTIIVIGIILTPMLALQAWYQGQGLKIIEETIGTSVPSQTRQTIEAIARATYSLCWATTVQNIAILLALKSDYLRITDQHPETLLFNIGLIIASVMILTGVMHRFVHVAIALSPIVMLTLAGYGRVDIFAISTWQTMFAMVCAVILVGIQSKEQFEIAVMLGRERTTKEVAAKGVATKGVAATEDAKSAAAKTGAAEDNPARDNVEQFPRGQQDEREGVTRTACRTTP